LVLHSLPTAAAASHEGPVSFTELRSNGPSGLSGARDGVGDVRCQTKFIDSMSYVGESPSHGRLLRVRCDVRSTLRVERELAESRKARAI